MKDIAIKYTKNPLLSTSNKKLNADDSVKIYGLSLVPHKMGGGYSICPHSTPGCRASCLVFSGNARFTKVNISRMEKTQLFLQDKDTFLTLLKAELSKVHVESTYSERNNIIAVRLNMFSDIPWERHIDMNDYTNTQFYDYTKNPNRMNKFLKGEFTYNYHLTFSVEEETMGYMGEIIKNGGTAALVFKLKKGQDMPTEWNGYKVVNGDLTDYRPLDRKGVIVGLKYKNPVANKNKKGKEIFSIDLRG